MRSQYVPMAQALCSSPWSLFLLKVDMQWKINLQPLKCMSILELLDTTNFSMQGYLMEFTKMYLGFSFLATA